MREDTSMPQLPTIEQCQTFLERVNAERANVDLPQLETVEFDSCIPNDGGYCLSATNLYASAGWCVGASYLWTMSNSDNRLKETHESGPYASLRIPHEIKVVTDFFDNCDEDELELLRERMVDAGVVEP